MLARFALLATMGLIFGGCGASSADSPPTVVLYDRTVGTLHFRGLRFAPGELTQNRAEAAAREFVKENAGAAYSSLMMFEDNRDVTVSQLGTVPLPESDSSFEQTLKNLESVIDRSQPLRPIGRVLALRESALLSYRPRSYYWENKPALLETVIKGHDDPTGFGSETKQYRLLVLAPKGTGPANAPDVALYFKSTGLPNCSACEDLVQEFRHLLPLGAVEAEIRTDSWFASLWFPLFFRFDRDASKYVDMLGKPTFPSVYQYYRAPHVRCNRYGERFQCENYGQVESIQR